MSSLICCDNYKAAPKKLVAHAWYIALVLVLVDVVVSIAAAARQDQADAGASGIAFAAVWSMLVLIALAIAGTNTLRRHHSEFAIGLLLGCCAMVSQMFLVLCAVFAGLVKGEDRQSFKDASIAMSFFCAVNFVIFLVFAILLNTFKDEIIVDSEGRTKKEAAEAGSTQHQSTPVQHSPAETVPDSI